MNLSDLTQDQRVQLHRLLARQESLLYQVKQRMESNGLDKGESELFTSVVRVYESLETATKITKAARDASRAPEPPSDMMQKKPWAGA